VRCYSKLTRIIPESDQKDKQATPKRTLRTWASMFSSSKLDDVSFGTPSNASSPLDETWRSQKSPFHNVSEPKQKNSFPFLKHNTIDTLPEQSQSQTDRDFDVVISAPPMLASGADTTATLPRTTPMPLAWSHSAVPPDCIISENIAIHEWGIRSQLLKEIGCCNTIQTKVASWKMSKPVTDFLRLFPNPVSNPEWNSKFSEEQPNACNGCGWSCDSCCPVQTQEAKNTKESKGGVHNGTIEASEEVKDADTSARSDPDHTVTKCAVCDKFQGPSPCCLDCPVCSVPLDVNCSACASDGGPSISCRHATTWTRSTSYPVSVITRIAFALAAGRVRAWARSTPLLARRLWSVSA
jgi:hypothetical protein